jgi:hypothetical protein
MYRSCLRKVTVVRKKHCAAKLLLLKFSRFFVRRRLQRHTVRLLNHGEDGNESRRVMCCGLHSRLGVARRIVSYCCRAAFNRCTMQEKTVFGYLVCVRGRCRSGNSRWILYLYHDDRMHTNEAHASICPDC